MFKKKENEQLENLSPEELAALKKQRSLNRVFGLLVAVSLILGIMLIYEIVLIAIR